MSKQNIVVCTVLVESSPQALPLGAACIVSALKADSVVSEEYTPELVSFSREDEFLIGVKTEDTALRISEHINKYFLGKKNSICPPAICFSLYVWNREILILTAENLRHLIPNVILIAGGPEVTARPDSFGTTFDYTIPRAGEIPVPALFRQIIAAAKKTTIPDGKLIDKPLDIASPSPYLDGTLDPAKYDGALWELARGCPFSCSYCYESKGEKKVLYFPEERLKKELDLFSKKKIGQVFVLDPTYNADKKRALEILHYIKKAAPDIYFNFEIRAEYLDRQLAQSFAEIPCSLQIGLQSADPEVLRLVHRTLDRKNFAKKVNLLNESGAIFGFDLIYGLPGDTLAGFCDSIDYAISLYPNHIELFRLAVLPGTDLYDRAVSGDLKLSYMDNPPYSVLSSPTFSTLDIEKATCIANATNLFYSCGRAVGWFNTVIKPLKLKPSVFFKNFATFLGKSDFKGKSPLEIEKEQLDFVRQKYNEKQIDSLFPVAASLIKLNGALARATAEKSTEKIKIDYHPDDLLSEYGTDIRFFASNVRRCPCNVLVFPVDGCADYKIVK